MSEKPANAEAPQKWAFDKTLNIPTMLMICGMTTSAVLFVARGWSEQDRRIDAAERHANMAVNEVRRLEGIQSAQSSANSDQISSIRNEFRSDLRDINSKLDTLVMRVVK